MRLGYILIVSLAFGCAKHVNVYNLREVEQGRLKEMQFLPEQAKSIYSRLPDTWKYIFVADVNFFFYYPDSNANAYKLVSRAYEQLKDEEVLYRLALFAEASGMYERSARYYEEYVIKYPQGKFYKEAISAVDRIFPKNFKEGDAATYKDGRITLMELEREIENKPVFLRPKYEKYEEKVKLLNEMAERRFAVSEALKQGLHREKAFRERFYNKLRDRFAMFVFDSIRRIIKVDSSEVKEYYEKNKEAFMVKPYVKAYMEVWNEDTLPNDSFFKKLNPKILSPERTDTSLYNYLSSLKEDTLVVLKRKDTTYVVKILRIQPAKYKPLSEVYRTIENILINEKQRKLWESFIDELMKDKELVILLDTSDTSSRYLDDYPKDTLAIVKGLNFVITKDVYMNYVGSFPPFARKQLLEVRNVPRFIGILAQREAVFRYAVAYMKAYLRLYDFMQNTFEQELYNYYKESFLSGVEVSEEEMKRYYEDNKESMFRVPGSAKLRRVVVKDRKLAHRLFRYIKKHPESMDSIAKVHTIYSPERSTGGLAFISENLMKDYYDKLGKYAPGKIYIFKWKDGYHIVKLLEYNPPRIQDYAEVKLRIRRIILGQKRNEAWKEHVESLKKQYNFRITLKDDEGHKTKD